MGIKKLKDENETLLWSLSYAIALASYAIRGELRSEGVTEGAAHLADLSLEELRKRGSK